MRCLLLLLGVLTSATTGVGAEPLAQPWKGAYSGKDSSGAHVIGHWKFEPGQEAVDSGPRALPGKLDGAVPAAEGKFGGGLESFPGYPIIDKHHALVVAAHPSLSPAAAFTAEMWVRAKPDLAKASLTYLLDKKYASHHDFQWLLSTPEKSGARRMQVNLGFGTDSDSFVSESLLFEPDTWHHIAFTYDGAGTVRFYRDGSTVGAVSHPGRRSVTAGANGLSIGDRLGSNYGGFPGFIDEVRLSQGVLEFSPVAVELSIPRTVWIRHEPAPKVEVRVRNLQSEPLTGATLSFRGVDAPSEPVAIPVLKGGQTHVLEREFNTQLRADDYDLRAILTVPGEPPIQREATLAIKLVPRPLPYRMPVLMWGIGSPSEFEKELPRLQHLGFNQCFGFGADVDAVWRAGKPVVADAAAPSASVLAIRQMLDEALASNFGIAAQLQPGYYLKQRKELARINRKGEPYARHDANAALPGLAEFSENVGKSVAETYGAHPAFVSALINSEVRDDSEVSFSEFDRAAYKKFSGSDIPDAVLSKSGVAWKNLKDFPADRIIADDHELLQFYRWFWTVGDGWNTLHTALHRGLKSTGRDDLWTWYDPAIRVPSIGSSGGDVDVLSQWTYTEPSPLRVGYFCDEVFAMAAASSRPQRVMKMTQLFWYRSTSAPLKTGANFVASPFDDHDPDAAYISIAPMHLRGSFWTKLSRPISGLMYHGWSSLVPTDGTHAYKYTQPDLQTEFSRLHREVLTPLGPTLLQVPDRPADVAYLDSFTSQMFAHRGSYGYSHDEAYLTLLHAQLQPQVIFEQTLLKDGLDNYKVLVLVDCDVLTAGVASRIREFQKRGGIVIGDPNLAPGIKADIVLPRFVRTKKTAEDKATILANAQTLRETLDKRYQRYAECSNPEIVTRVRASGESDYVFVVNDHREFGNYVGQHGLVMEQGLPSAGRLSLRRAKAHVYDLRSSRPVATTLENGVTTWPVELGPCDGGVFLATPQPIDKVSIAAPDEARLNSGVDVVVQVQSAAGSAIPAVIPMHVEITDPNGRVGEFSGEYGAAQGTLKLHLDLARNDTPGVWQIRAREGASGREATRFLRVKE